MGLENQTVIIWTNEIDDINDILYKLRKKGATVYMASFPGLSETAIFIEDIIYAIEQIEVLLEEK